MARSGLRTLPGCPDHAPFQGAEPVVIDAESAAPADPPLHFGDEERPIHPLKVGREEIALWPSEILRPVAIEDAQAGRLVLSTILALISFRCRIRDDSTQSLERIQRATPADQ